MGYFLHNIAILYHILRKMFIVNSSFNYISSLWHRQVSFSYVKPVILSKNVFTVIHGGFYITWITRAGGLFHLNLKHHSHQKLQIPSSYWEKEPSTAHSNCRVILCIFLQQKLFKLGGQRSTLARWYPTRAVPLRRQSGRGCGCVLSE